MHDIVWVLLLVRLEYLAHIFIYVVRCFNLAGKDEPHPTVVCSATHRRCEVDNCPACDVRLLMIISNFYVYDMDWLVEIATAREQV